MACGLRPLGTWHRIGALSCATVLCHDPLESLRSAPFTLFWPSHHRDGRNSWPGDDPSPQQHSLAGSHQRCVRSRRSPERANTSSHSLVAPLSGHTARVCATTVAYRGSTLRSGPRRSRARVTDGLAHPLASGRREHHHASSRAQPMAAPPTYLRAGTEIIPMHMHLMSSHRADRPWRDRQSGLAYPPCRASTENIPVPGHSRTA